MERKPPRRTRERILDLSLRLFNEFGEPNITTTVIADEMNISPGNLYYHFRNKDDIVNSIFASFEKEIDGLLDVPGNRQANIEDAWLYLQVSFELIWRYRFLYRDLNDLLSRNRTLEIHFKRILKHKVDVARRLCQGLVESGDMMASQPQINALATNMVVVATYWLSFEYVRDPRHFNDEATMSAALANGVYQVMCLLAPYLQGNAKELFESLAQSFITEENT
ncbi:MAG: TetR/AcrR family transcriptional regulator [Pseudomonadota bacterium]|jgi:AcrR family transcriptional regulator|uniref:TetR/AcrR family transcriptional regulator n=1 Tax=Limnobacter TaxID=131079 RepID=UPI001109EFCA|nr:MULTISPECIES: TetR/AcrR family transcriptional regulator [Limnobacter]VWX36374.1 TetR/AcrR family transcriptional regulator [Limnobacter sp. 130]